MDIQGSVVPAGISRPKHKRTFTGFGAGEIKTVEGIFFLPFSELGCELLTVRGSSLKLPTLSSPNWPLHQPSTVWGPLSRPPANTPCSAASIPEPQREAWRKHQVSGFQDKDGFEREVVRHVETTLARSMFNCDESAAYSACALAFRDRLILEWNRTQQRQTFADSKRVYYLSLEFLMGRALDNAMLNIGQKDLAKSEFWISWGGGAF